MKPMIAVEYYELTQAIAACSVKIGFLDSKCVLKDEHATPHLKGLAYQNWFIEGCSVYAIGMPEEDGNCYHTNANAAFNS